MRDIETEGCPHCAPSARVVTAAQVDGAVAQLRERPGRSAAEQIQAVLRALDLTVVPDPVIPDPR
jgi:glutaredoxin